MSPLINAPAFTKPPSTEEQSELYRICALNFSSRTQAMLKMVLDRYGDNRFSFSSLAESELLLINGDAPDVINETLEARTSHPCPVIVLSTTQRSDIQDAVCLLNPISPKLLIEALNQQLEKNRQPRAHETPTITKEKKVESLLKSPPPLPPELHTNSQRFSFTPAEIEAARAEWQHTRETLKIQKLGQAASVLEHDRGSPDNRGGFLRDVNLEDPKQLRRIYFQPEGTLAGLLRKMLLSVSDHSSLLDVSINGKQLIFDFALNRWGGDYDEQQLRAVSLGALPRTLGVRWIPREEFTRKKLHRQDALEMVVAQATPSKMQPIPDHRKQRAEFILAQIGLWCAHGRLPEGTDINAPLRLRYWPNMPHLPRTPGAMRIAALWMQKPSSLIGTLQLTGMTQREVFAFYVICHTLNLLSLERSKDASTLPAIPEGGNITEPSFPQKTVAEKSFLRRLMNRVWSSGEENSE